MTAGPSAPAPAPDDAAFLDDAFAATFARLEDGLEPDLEPWRRARPHLHDALLALVAAARQALGPATAPVAAAVGAGPEVAGYTILRPLGRGGMGTVYVARQHALGREVALKVLPPGAALATGARQRFLSEARALARVTHPHVVRVHDVLDTEAVGAFAMELVAGASLGDLLTAVAQSPASQRLAAAERKLARRAGQAATLVAADHTWTLFLVRVGCEMADALAAVHAQGLVHRDVKPANILIRADGRAVLADFGLVRELASPGHQTVPGQFLGTVHYAAPEQLRGAHDAVDARTDVYALGATLYHALALTPPFDRAHPSRILARILVGDLRPLGRVDPSLPRDLCRVVATAMDPEPAHRYADAAALAEDLRNVLALRPVRAQGTGAWRRLLRSGRRRPALVAALLAVLGVTLAAAVLFYGWAQQARVREQIAQDRLLVPGLLAQVPQLLPVGTDRVAELDRWLALAQDTLDRRPQHAARAAQILARAQPAPAPQAQVESQRMARATDLRAREARRLAHLDHALRDAEPDVNAEWLMHFTQSLRERLATTPPPASRPAVVCARPADQETLALLTGLLPQLDRLADVLPQVVARRDTLAAAARQWQSARAATWTAVAGMAPQRDLVPLGPDPNSGLQEFAHLATGQAPVRDPATGQLRLDADSALVLVLIPAATATVGAQRPAEGGSDGVDYLDRLAGASEVPPEQVALAAFFLSKFELTQAQWQRVTGTNPSWYAVGTKVDGRPIDGRHPVEMLTREDALPVLTALGLCLPTAAQWEHACRAGTTTRYWTGAELATLEGAENVEDAGSALRAGVPRKDVAAAVRGGTMARWDDGWLVHAPVGSFRPNAFGLFDMAGNVCELCQDLGPSAAGTTGRAPLRPGDGLRTLSDDGWLPSFRGSAFQLSLAFARVSASQWGAPGFRHARQGVRPARRVLP